MRFSYDKSREAELFKAVKTTPAISAIALNRVSLVKFRETIAQNINYLVTIYAMLAIVITVATPMTTPSPKPTIVV